MKARIAKTLPLGPSQPPPQTPKHERVRTEGMQLHHLVFDLLDFAKVEAGKMDVNFEPVKVAERLSEAERGFKLIVE